MVDYALIKTNLRSLFNDANTTTASYDLSTGMDKRVVKILSVHPLRIPVQVSYYPYVSVFIESKSIKQATIARTQSNAKRDCVVTLKIAGGYWNAKISDKTQDAADNGCELLMENIEEVLRSDPTLNNACLWQIPNMVTFHNQSMDEESSLRIGILSVDLKLLS